MDNPGTLDDSDQTDTEDMPVPSHCEDTQSSEDESDTEIVLPECPSNVVAENDESAVDYGTDIQRRSSRSRRRPDRYGASTSYDSDSPFNGEDDMVQNYWPNYPRGSWRPEADQ